MGDKIRIGMRGATGLLGSRLGKAILESPDMKLVLASVVRDKTLEDNLLTPSKAAGRVLPQWDGVSIYVDGQNQTKNVRELNESSPLYHFIPASRLQQNVLNRDCDIFVDTTMNVWGKDTWAERYNEYTGPIILQSSDTRPGSRLYTPPVKPEPGDGRMYRLGSCALSGLVPMIYPVMDKLKAVRVHVTMQYDEKLMEYPIHQNIHTMVSRRDSAIKLQQDLVKLLPDKRIAVDGVVQIPGHDYYTVQLQMKFDGLTSDEVRSRYRNHPRILLAPKVINSTGAVDFQLREKIQTHTVDNKRNIPPIVIYDDFYENGDYISVVAALYSKAVTMNPNLDAIRILANNEDPIEAMKRTDQSLGYETNGASN